tara:strand:- start:698 stop:805 length:108 start_codon:yes stop_codon:yes gene_type:complete
MPRQRNLFLKKLWKVFKKFPLIGLGGFIPALKESW